MASSFRGWSGLDWFIPPDQRSSAIDVFRGRAITATTLFAGISFGAVSLFRAVAAEASFEWVLAVTFFSALLIVAPFLYRYTGSTRIVTGIVLVSGIFGAPLVGYYAGFFPAPVMLAFPLLPLAIALLENLRMTVIATGGAIAGILYLYFSLAQQGDQSQAFVVVSIGMTVLVGGLGVAYERVLRHSFEELNDVTEQLRRTGATARDANAAKSEFLARMSHEIRTPLTVIMALGSLHADRREIPEELRADFEAIKAAADSLNVLVNNALDMAGIEELELQLRPTAFEPWFNEISAGLQAIARQQEVSLGVSLRRPCPVNVSIDAAKLNQVLTNLVLNAVKHTSADSSVLVCVEAAGEVLDLSVRDFGAGITTDDVDQLFEAFETAETEEAAGAGLGLAVSRRLVELMGGTLEAENHPDGGAQFTARVPVPGAQYAESPGTGGDAAGVGGHSLLLIDDNDLVRDSLAAFFRRSGARITVAEGGAAALALVDEGLRPTLVVLDMHMPGMDGVATARALRDRPATRRVPILALSADALPEMTAAAAEAGVTEYYVKPLDRKGLDRIVARYLG